MVDGDAGPGLVDGILPYLPIPAIRAAFARSPGNEFGSGKFQSGESSAALAANMFGFFLEEPSLVPDLVGLGPSWRPTRVELEWESRFPWTGGLHPWLDAAIFTETHLIGIESKRYEPFRSKPLPAFSPAFWRPVWGDDMQPYQRLRNRLVTGELSFRHLDACQLVKHAFGLRTQASERGLKAFVVYVHAEPNHWPGGRLIASEAIVRHRSEVEEFARLSQGGEVGFASWTYRQLCQALRDSGKPDAAQHAERLTAHFGPL